MIILEHFKERLPQAHEHHKQVQDAFLHHLFPESFPEYQAPALGLQWMSYHQVAVAGYLSAQGIAQAKARFTEGMAWLKDLVIAPADLRSNEMALLGLAAGIRGLPNAEQQNAISWLTRLPAQGSALEGFLKAFLQGQHLLGLPDVYELGANLLAGRSCDPHALAAYLRAARKNSPLAISDDYGPNFFQAMLSIRIMDEAMSMLIAGEKIWQEPQRRAQCSAARRANWITFGLALAWGIGLSLAGILLFIHADDAQAHQRKWDSLKWALLFLGGPLPCLAYLSRAAYFLIRGKRPDWTLENIRTRLQGILLRRILDRRGLPPNQA